MIAFFNFSATFFQYLEEIILSNLMNKILVIILPKSLIFDMLNELSIGESINILINKEY